MTSKGYCTSHDNIEQLHQESELQSITPALHQSNCQYPTAESLVQKKHPKLHRWYRCKTIAGDKNIPNRTALAMVQTYQHRLQLRGKKWCWTSHMMHPLLKRHKWWAHVGFLDFVMLVEVQTKTKEPKADIRMCSNHNEKSLDHVLLGTKKKAMGYNAKIISPCCNWFPTQFLISLSVAQDHAFLTDCHMMLHIVRNLTRPSFTAFHPRLSN